MHMCVYKSRNEHIGWDVIDLTTILIYIIERWIGIFYTYFSVKSRQDFGVSMIWNFNVETRIIGLCHSNIYMNVILCCGVNIEIKMSLIMVRRLHVSIHIESSLL